ncbi:uncharacterized protein LOC119838006 [Zerene cesonia]|uniref:uncharacterized protein LOC119838006 n=1 Tax=Zerene cesonia TaxID=33412 RepID=UPI0018E506EE|nr:uncharacterized protein LOC119838006 [Zerene cesonia]
MINYYKNFVLCGEIDFHCLLCQESFKNLESVDKHLKWEKHRKTLKSQEYAFRKEFIYKVRNDYYCEVCNELSINASKHKEKDSHKKNKKNPEGAIKKKPLVITRISDDTFSIEQLKVNILQWHGIKNDYCTLCKRAVRNVSIHITLNVHIINLIGFNNKAECLECKEIVRATLEVMLKHRNKHTSNENVDSDSSKESYEVKFCEVVDHGKRRHELAKYGKSNFITLNRGGSWGYCTLCDVHISAHMKQAIDHVQGLRHRAFLEYIGVRKSKHHEEPPPNKVKMVSYLPHIYRVEYNRTYYIKDHLPVNDLSFMLMKEIGKKATKVKCFVCETTLDRDAATEHYKTKTHIEKVLACYVFQSEEGMEFIRLIRPDLYHCGICNRALAYWESVRSHVRTLPHTFNKSQRVLHCAEARQLRQKYGVRTKYENITFQLKRLGLL